MDAVLPSDMTKFAGIVPDATAASTTIVQICWILRNRSGANIGGVSDVCAMMTILKQTNENGIPGIIRDIRAHNMTRPNIRPGKAHNAKTIIAKGGTTIHPNDGDIQTQGGPPSNQSDEETLAAVSKARSNLAHKPAA